MSLFSRHDLDLEPALYWTPMARWAVRTNKLRVLTHLRGQAEQMIFADLRGASPPVAHRSDRSFRGKIEARDNGKP